MPRVRDRLLPKVCNRVAREPVLLGAAVLATVEVAFPHWSPAAMLAAGAWVAFFQRMMTTSKRKAEEDVEVAKYVGALERPTQRERRTNPGVNDPPAT